MGKGGTDLAHPSDPQLAMTKQQPRNTAARPHLPASGVRKASRLHGQGILIALTMQQPNYPSLPYNSGDAERVGIALRLLERHTHTYYSEAGKVAKTL